MQWKTGDEITPEGDQINYLGEEYEEEKLAHEDENEDPPEEEDSPSEEEKLDEEEELSEEEELEEGDTPKEKKSGNLYKALQESRSNQAETKRELDAVKNELNQIKKTQKPTSQTGDQTGQPQFEMPELNLPDGDLLDMQPGELRKSISEFVQKGIQTALQQVQGQTQEQLNHLRLDITNRMQVDQELAKYPVFKHKDKRLADAAIREVASRLDSEGALSMPEIVKDTAKYYSRLITKESSASKPKKATKPAPKSTPKPPASAEAAHVAEKQTKAKSMEDINKMADKVVSRFKRKSARGGK